MAPDLTDKTFRNYDDQSSTILVAVREHYRKMRMNQTVDYVKRMKLKYLGYDRPMSFWHAMEKLNELIDVSDPDISLPNVQHLIQSAEALRADNRPDWMQLVGLIHDLGKIMYLKGNDEDGTSQREQWGLVGDTFVVGNKLPESCVYPEFNSLNPDMDKDEFNTDLGMYQSHCGLDNLNLAWGHDEYLYHVLQNHPMNTIPKAGMAMIRYHSFYPWHTGGSYEMFQCEKDTKYREWILDFNRYDLYTKSQATYDLEDIKAYYSPIVEKYLGPGPISF